MWEKEFITLTGAQKSILTDPATIALSFELLIIIVLGFIKNNYWDISEIEEWFETTMKSQRKLIRSWAGIPIRRGSVIKLL